MEPHLIAHSAQQTARKVMLTTLLRAQWLNLKRDYVALGLTFVLPIVFFSIFAAIFGGMGGGGGGLGGSQALDVIAIDLDDTEISRRFIEQLDQEEGLTVVTHPPATNATPGPRAYTRAEAEPLVRGGDFDVAVILPAGFGGSFGDFAGGAGEPVTVIYDPANPIAEYAVTGMLQAAAFQAAPDVLMERGLGQLEAFGGGLTPGQEQAIDFLRPFLRGEKSFEELGNEDATGDRDEAAAAEADEAGFAGLVQVESINVRSLDEEGDAADGQFPMIPYYAAGIGVMFLLFSMTGAAGSLLEEEESGALDRVLSSNVTMGRLLAAKWLFFGVLGFLQVAIMFVWGAVVFGLDLWTVNHLVGFALVAAVTALAASAFGLVLAAACRSRAQLGGISTIVILIMSALGGSMVPRFLMPEFMNTVSRFTFNGWALDGFLAVFWEGAGDDSLATTVVSVSPAVGVIAAMGAGFLVIARVLAKRWEAS